MRGGSKLTDLDEKQRTLIGLRAGCGALFASSMVPLVSFVSSVLGLVPGFPLLYGVAEGVFWVHSKRQWQRLNSAPRSGKLVDVAAAWATFRRVQGSMVQLRVPPAEWLSAWFRGVDVADLGRQDVEEFVATSIWHGSRQEVEDAGNGTHLRCMVQELEEACGRPLVVEPASMSAQLPATSLSPSPDFCSMSTPWSMHSQSVPLINSASNPLYTNLEPAGDMTPGALEVIQPSCLSCYDAPDLPRTPSQEVFSHSCSSLSSISASSGEEQAAPIVALAHEAAACPAVVRPGVKGFTFQPGHAQPAVSFYDHTREPLPHWHRPLAIYCAHEFMSWMNHTMLSWAGFKKHRQDNLVYFTYNVPHLTSSQASSRRPTPRPKSFQDEQGYTALAAQPAASAAPIVLLHGVGLGLLPYIRMLVSLAATGAPVIAVEYKHVGQRWCKDAPSLTDLRDTVLAILRKHGYGIAPAFTRLSSEADSPTKPHQTAAQAMGLPRASVECLRGFGGVDPLTSSCEGDLPELLSPAGRDGQGQGVHLIGHSFGTLVASSIVQAAPQAVSTLTLLDPVCFHMWLPSLLINFIYRPQRLLRGALSPSTSPAALQHAVLETVPGEGELHITCPPIPSSPTGSPLAAGPCMEMSQQGRGLGGLVASVGRAWWSGVQLVFNPSKWAVWRLLPRLPPLAVLGKEVMLVGPAREMHCTAALCRLLDWQQASLWPEALPAPGRCIIALAGCDELVPAEQLAAWAHSYTTATVEYAPHLAHADILNAGPEQDVLLAKILHMINSATSTSQPPITGQPQPQPQPQLLPVELQQLGSP